MLTPAPRDTRFSVLLAHEMHRGATHSRIPPCFVLLGPPGAGKGTLGVLLEQYLGFRHLSCGELLRQASVQGYVCERRPVWSQYRW